MISDEEFLLLYEEYSSKNLEFEPLREFQPENSRFQVRDRRGSNSRFFLKSIRHTKVEILSLKSCFLRKKETKLDANL